MFDRVRQEFHSPMTVLWFTGWMSSDASVAWQVSLTTPVLAVSFNLGQRSIGGNVQTAVLIKKWCAPGCWWDHMTNLSQWGVSRNAVWLLIRGNGNPICNSTASLMELSQGGHVHQPRSLGGEWSRGPDPCWSLMDSCMIQRQFLVLKSLRIEGDFHWQESNLL